MNLSTLPTLSAGQLAKLAARAELESGAVCTAMIEAGRGHELHSETLAKARQLDADPLTLRFAAASAVSRAISGERQDRRTWHGSDKPIKRGMAA